MDMTLFNLDGAVHLANRRPGSRNEIFTGEVTRNTDTREWLSEYILLDEARKTNYYLTNGANVHEYVGKKVKVAGILDRKNATIHVESIEGFDWSQPPEGGVPVVRGKNIHRRRE